MDWIKAYCDLLTLPKWIALSDRAKALLVQAWLFAGKAETDGYVPDSAKRLIGWSAAADRELEGVWWHRNGAGWVLHDWEDHQVSADDIREQRERRRAGDRERQKRRRDRLKEGQTT
jgi:hypothetical protein